MYEDEHQRGVQPGADLHLEQGTQWQQWQWKWQQQGWRVGWQGETAPEGVEQFISQNHCQVHPLPRQYTQAVQPGRWRLPDYFRANLLCETQHKGLPTESQRIETVQWKQATVANWLNTAIRFGEIQASQFLGQNHLIK